MQALAFVLLALVAFTYAQQATVPGGCCFFTETQYKGEQTCTNSSIGFNLEVKIMSYFCERAYSAAFFDKANLIGDPIELAGCGEEVPVLVQPMAVNSVSVGPCQRVSCCFYSTATFDGAEYCISSAAPAPAKEELAEVQKEAKWKSMRCNAGNTARLTHAAGAADVPCGGEFKPTSDVEYTAVTVSSCGSGAKAFGDEAIDDISAVATEEQITVDQAVAADQAAFDAALPVEEALPVDEGLFVDQAISSDPALDQVFGADQAVAVDQVDDGALPGDLAVAADQAVFDDAALPVEQALPVEEALPTSDFAVADDQVAALPVEEALPTDSAVADQEFAAIPVDESVPVDDGALPTDQAVAADDLLFSEDDLATDELISELDLAVIDTFDQAVSEDPAVAADLAVMDDQAVVDFAAENVEVDQAVQADQAVSDFITVEDALAAGAEFVDQAVSEDPVTADLTSEEQALIDMQALEADLALADHAVGDNTDAITNSAFTVSVSTLVVLVSIFAALL